MQLRLPRHLPLSVKLAVGELHAVGLAADLTVDLGVGEAEVKMAEAVARTVTVDVGVGQATLTAGRQQIDGSGFLGRNIAWTGGSGTARIAVDCGVGEVSVTLE